MTLRTPLLAAAVLVLAACVDQPVGATPPPSPRVAPVDPAPALAAQGREAGARTVATRPAATLPTMRVHKSPSCGCCGLWVEHMRHAGFRVEVHDTDDMEPIKKRLGVPFGKGSCHTAEVGGLVIEGHVPASDIKRLLALDDDARGLVLPGMPAGSPGMEMPDGRVSRYVVERVNADGSTEPFAVHGD